MTATTAPPTRRTHDDSSSRLGRWCLAAALVGVVQGATLLVWPPQVADTRFSYPLTATGHVIAQATFFLQHLPLVLAVGALAALPYVRAHRAARAGLLAASLGLGLLAITELIAMAAATADNDSTLAATISALYTVPVLLIGGGLTVGGGVLVRRGAVTGKLAWLLVALGVFVFVGLTPALASGSFLAGRLAIMAWMLLFAALGWTMSRGAVAPPERSDG